MKFFDKIVRMFSGHNENNSYRSQNRNSTSVAESILQNGILRFSEHEKFCRHITKLTDDDIIAISHKKADGTYESAFVKIKLLKDYIIGR